ncbi:Copper metallochaperone, bacterial analog of Cox17 protein [plant metagenome]|uniref:Copper metallochaperone, bacterial analog of Cox17 protein n=1 Tax=plant metagenome TaxID=1297885 RepID=A0A484QCL6_9ZZZZ
MKTILSKSALAVAGLLVSAAAVAADAARPPVQVDEAWVRATVPQQQATGAFMRLTAQTDSKLVSAASPAAKVVEIHEMAMQGDVMKMRQVDTVALPAGKAVELAPGGYHIMLLGLEAQAKEGDKVPLTLTFESADGKRESVEVDATVRPLASGGASGGHGAAGGHGKGGGHGH